MIEFSLLNNLIAGMCIWYLLLKMIKVSNPKFMNGFKKRNVSLIFRIPSYFLNIKLISIPGMCFPLSWSKAWSSPSSCFRPGGGGLQVAAVRVRQPELGHLRRIWVTSCSTINLFETVFLMKNMFYWMDH